MGILLWMLWAFAYLAASWPTQAQGPELRSGTPGPVSGVSRGPNDQPGGQAPEISHKLVLAPFFLVQGKGTQVRVERIIFYLEPGNLKETKGFDPEGPALRNALYDLLNSGLNDYALCSQALSHLQRQWGKEAFRGVTLSRSFLITR